MPVATAAVAAKSTAVRQPGVDRFLDPVTAMGQQVWCSGLRLGASLLNVQIEKVAVVELTTNLGVVLAAVNAEGAAVIEQPVASDRVQRRRR